MNALVIIAIVFLAFLAFILFTPVSIEVDSERNLYQIRIAGLARVNIILGEPFILFRIHALGFTKTIDPLSMKTKTKKKEKQKKERKRMPFRQVLRKASAIAQTFKVRYFYLNIDTGDFLINGLLFPLAQLASGNGRALHVNFRGEKILKLKIVNTVERMLLAFIR